MLRRRLQDTAIKVLRKFDPERAHQLTLEALKTGLGPGDATSDDPVLRVDALSRSLPNPIGLAAGFDKNAEVPDALLKMGFGFVEVGTITPLPQEGNAKPRIFRLPEDGAIINRLGFNNKGLDHAHQRLKARRGRPGLVGANLGANRDSSDRVADYITGLRRLYGLADYFVINISSPNTPGLRNLQSGDMFEELLERFFEARDEITPLPDKSAAILVKVAPDLSDLEKTTISNLSRKKGVNGLIVSNTTIGSRDGLKSARRDEHGGLSGKPLMEVATKVLSEFHRETNGEILLVGVGGVANGYDAYQKIRAGAKLVQLYTALTYAGPGLIHDLKRDLAARLKADGFQTLAEAVGTGISNEKEQS